LENILVAVAVVVAVVVAVAIAASTLEKDIHVTTVENKFQAEYIAAHTD
jgi:K+-transporting ATPase A subunit